MLDQDVRPYPAQTRSRRFQGGRPPAVGCAFRPRQAAAGVGSAAAADFARHAAPSEPRSVPSMQEFRSSSLRSFTRSRVYFEFSAGDWACPSGASEGQFAARSSAVGLLTCGGDEDGPAPSAVLGIGDVQQVTSSGRRGFRGLPGGTHRTRQDHPLARCQRGSVTARTAPSLCDRAGQLAAPGISYRFCRCADTLTGEHDGAVARPTDNGDRR
jgi:hypothetical protein